jgi:hypothetical protein
MALFKINRGLSENIPSTITDGYAYFCTDTGELFIDYADEDGKLYRQQMNAKKATQDASGNVITTTYVDNSTFNAHTATHAPSNAEKNQNAFSNIKVGSTTIAADTTTDTLTLVGSNVTITPDATNDKVTIAVSDGTTSAKGVVQLTNSTSSTSTTTAATPSSVKSAYDLADSAYSLVAQKSQVQIITWGADD